MYTLYVHIQLCTYLAGRPNNMVECVPYVQYIFKHANFQTPLETVNHSSDVVLFPISGPKNR